MKRRWKALLVIVPAGLAIGLVAGRAVDPEMIQEAEGPLSTSDSTADTPALRQAPVADPLASSSPSSRPDADYEREVWPGSGGNWRSEGDAWSETYRQDYGSWRGERPRPADDPLQSDLPPRSDYSYRNSLEPQDEDDFGGFGNDEPAAEQNSQEQFDGRNASPDSGTSDTQTPEPPTRSRPPAAPVPDAAEPVPQDDGMPAIY